jgi:hypothetical protein
MSQLPLSQKPTKKASATVTVNPPPPTLTQIALSRSSASISIGSQQQFTATAYDQYGHTITGIAFTFLSNNYSVAMMDSAIGIATGEAAAPIFDVFAEILEVGRPSFSITARRSPSGGWLV